MKWLEKYINDVRASKANAVKFSFIVAAIMFMTFFIYNRIAGQETKDSIIIAGMIGVIFFVIWFIFSINLVKRQDRTAEKISQAKKKEIEERRERLASGKKVNNKKKKKNKKD